MFITLTYLHLNFVLRRKNAFTSAIQCIPWIFEIQQPPLFLSIHQLELTYSQECRIFLYQEIHISEDLYQTTKVDTSTISFIFASNLSPTYLHRVMSIPYSTPETMINKSPVTKCIRRRSQAYLIGTKRKKCGISSFSPKNM